MFDTYEGDLKLGNPDEKKPEERSWISDASLAIDSVNLSYGEDVDNESRASVFSKYVDYKDNQKFYDAYADTNSWWRSKDSDNVNRTMYENAIEQGKFALDSEGNVVEGENATPISKFLFDLDAIKGGLLARANGYTKEVAAQAYSDFTKQRSQEISKGLEGSSLSSKIAGTLAGHIFRKETAIEVAASPAKIVGNTIVGGMAKAFATEFAIGAIGETIREREIAQHMEKANLDYTLWDSAKNILINAGLGGVIRGIGSGIVDARILKKVDSSKIDATDKEILNRFFQREQYKLTKNTNSHIELLHKTEQDINNGKPVDVSAHTDIDIDSKIDEAIEPISIVDIKAENDVAIRVVEDVESIIKEVDEVPAYKEATEADPYEGMATPQEAEQLIKEMSDVDPEIRAEMQAIEAEKKALSTQAQKLQEAASVKIGGSEDEAAKAAQDVMKKNTTKAEYRTDLNKNDIAELDRMEAEALAVEAETLFAKGGDNLAAGVIAGIDKDENGNITFDAEKFVIGLGGYTAVKALAKNKTIQKEFKEYVDRALNELEQKKGFDFVTGTQRVVPSERISKTKVVDEQGNPLKVYHGTGASFEEFDPNLSYDGGLWFTSDKKALEAGEVGAGSKGRIVEAYLDVKKMAGWEEYEKYSLDELRNQGFDGVKLDNDYIVFENSQIEQIKKPKGNN